MRYSSAYRHFSNEAFRILIGLCILECVRVQGTSTTFPVSDKIPEKHPYLESIANASITDQLKNLPQYWKNNGSELLQTTEFPPNSYVSQNGLVHTVIECYNNHLNLVLRPEDVWGAIMTQFSFYVNKHAEEFRGKFVNFEGKKELAVRVPGTLRDAPYDLVVKLMSEEINRNLVDPEVKNWILPSFSTTTENDLVTIGVVFMASMKKYFDYKSVLGCGIPTVTLEGTTDDWKDIQGRLEKLKEFKLEKWYDMLEPILKQFVDAKEGKVDTDFWQKICHHEAGGSGPAYVSGWITAFCVFDKDGNWQDSTTASNLFSVVNGTFQTVERKVGNWLRISTGDVPTGIVEVDMKIDDNGTNHDAIMFAGHLAAELKGNGTTVQPTLGWAIALKSESTCDA